MADTRTLARAIKTLREERDLSQTVLAGLAGISRNALTQIEIGRRDPIYSSIEGISGAFGIRPWQLLQYADRLQAVSDAPFDTYAASQRAERQAA